jgi:cysteine-rich repeat protein
VSLRFTIPLSVALFACAASDPIDLFALHAESSSDGDVGGSEAEGGSASDAGAPGSGGDTSEGGGAAAGPACGDAIIDAGETCDDANDVGGDGCNQCAIECAADSIQDPISGHCYRLFTTAQNQPSAEANCQAWGGAPGLGHLASMSSQSENDFVAPLVAGDTWIGADDFGGAFAWIDGTPWSFESWQTNEPNHPGAEHCMFMDLDAKWHDHDCGDSTRPAYLCERGAAAP